MRNLLQCFLLLLVVCQAARNPKTKKNGFDPHRYEDIVFVYFRMNEHNEKEPEHLVEVVKAELTAKDVKFSEVAARNFNYKKHGLAHIEVNMGKPRSKGARTVTDGLIEEENIEIDPTVFDAVMDSQEKIEST